MDSEEASGFTQSDPELSAEEKEFTVGFTKKDNRARIHTNISSQIKRALQHSDINTEEISVYNEASESIEKTTVDNFDGNGIIVSLRGTVPIESLKIQSNPRNSRGYADIISSQSTVDIDR